MTDKEVMLNVKDGDIDKLGILFERYNTKLYNYFLRLTYQPQQSEDLVQEVFLRILKYRHTYSGSGLFSTWLFQVAHNSFYDAIKKNKKHKQNQSIENIEYEIPMDLQVDNEIYKNEDIKILKKSLARLKAAEREVLILSRFQNMKYEEIAQLMNCAVGTIKTRVFYALKNLKKIYLELAGEV